jgi:uncharacterized protein (TIGR01244 family)
MRSSTLSRLPLFAALALALMTPAAIASTPAAAPATAPAAAPAAAEKPLLERSLRLEGVVLAPQPAAADFAALKGAGITRVINLRTPEEMAALGFDAEASAKDAGLAYATLPIAGNAGFTPDSLDAFTKAMAEGGGDLLLHCGSGARAGQLYAAWLVREKGVSPQEAMQRVAPLGLWPTPMERMLGRPLEIGFAPVIDAADPDAPKAD